MDWKHHTMSEALANSRIIQDPEVLGGKPVIAGTRISVELILEKLAAGRPPEEICYSHALPSEAISDALRYVENLPRSHSLSQLLKEYRAARCR